jgi:hypothetical protein
MAKRTRGTNRPGQRHSARPQSHSAGKPTTGLTEAEEARAAALEQELVSQNRVAEAGRSRSRASEPTRAGRANGQGLLAAKAAEEYAYVARDVRRIITVGSGMIAVFIAIWVLVNVAHVITFG